MLLKQDNLFSQVLAGSSPLKISKTFEVDNDTFRLSVNQIERWNFKIHLYKKIEGTWFLQQRHLKDADDFDGYQFQDWNHDGFTDLEIKFLNGPTLEHENFLFMYNPETKNFSNIENYFWYCGSYNDEIYIEETNSVYYSFNRLGCSGDLQASCIFTIKNDTIQNLGWAEINFCDEPFGIVIYKSNGETGFNQIATIPGAYIIKHYSKENYSPWYDYMCHYWEKYYWKFM